MPKIAIQNVNTPDKTSNVDADKYGAMFDAMMAGMSATPMTYAQIKAAVLPHLPDSHFPQGATAGWWIKAVQLDLEAKGKLTRHATKPLTWSKA